MGFHHTRAARERRRKRKFSAYDSAVRILRSLSLMDKNKVVCAGDDDDDDDTFRTSGEGHAPTKTRAGLNISIDVEAQDQMIRQKRKSLALRLKERIMRRVKPEPFTEGWSKDHGDEDCDDDERYQRRGCGCFGC